MTNFALFGAGFIGTIHGRNIAAHPRAALRYVYDVNHAAAERLAAELGATAVAAPAASWDAGDVDAVLIASSTDTHADLLETAIAAGLPAYCEKPIHLDIERVKDVARAAEASSVPVLVGFSRRYDANHGAVRRRLRDGAIGKVEMLHITARDPKPPALSYIAVSGGQFRDQTIHFFDLACWLTGEAPVEIYAAGASLVDPAIGQAGDTDTALIVMKMPSGALCHIDNSRRAAYGYDERVEILGATGMLTSDRKPVREVALYSGSPHGNTVAHDGLHAGWFERMEPTFRQALDAFVAAVEGDGSDFPTVRDGLRAQLIAEAAVASLRANRPVEVGYWTP